MECKYSIFKCNFSATLKDLLREEIHIFWSNIKYCLFFFRMEHDSIGMVWKAFQFQGDVRVHSYWNTLMLFFEPSLPVCSTLGHTQTFICPSSPPRTPPLFSEIFSEPHGFISILSVLQVYITFLLTFAMSSLLFCFTPDLELEAELICYILPLWEMGLFPRRPSYPWPL